MTQWMSWRAATNARPEELPAAARLSGKLELAQLDAAADLEGLAQRAGAQGVEASLHGARPKAHISANNAARRPPCWHKAITQAMQGLGMQGGQFQVALEPLGTAPTQRPRRRAVSGGGPCWQHATPGGQGGLGRRAVAHGAGHCGHHQPVGHRPNLIFDEVDSGRGRRCCRNRGPLDETTGPTGRCWQSPTCRRWQPVQTTIWWFPNRCKGTTAEQRASVD